MTMSNITIFLYSHISFFDIISRNIGVILEVFIPTEGSSVHERAFKTRGNLNFLSFDQNTNKTKNKRKTTLLVLIGNSELSSAIVMSLSFPYCFYLCNLAMF